MDRVISRSCLFPRSRKDCPVSHDQRQREYWEAEHGHRGYRHPVVQAFARQRVQQVFDAWLPRDHVRNALDVGCGNGFSTYYVAERIPDITAVDRSEHMLERHPLRGSANLLSADARHLPFEDNSFDLVYAWEVLHHIPDPSEVLREMARVSRRYVLVAEPNRYNPALFAYALADPEHRWTLRFSLNYMRRQCRQAGLRVVRADIGGWIFPNKAPLKLLPVLLRLPFWFPLATSNWVLCETSQPQA